MSRGEYLETPVHLEQIISEMKSIILNRNNDDFKHLSGSIREKQVDHLEYTSYVETNFLLDTPASFFS